MLQMMVRTEPFTKEQIPEKLKEHGVRVNGYAEAYFAHPRFSVGCGETIPVTIASLRELGFEDRATLADIFGRLPQAGLRPCSPGTGLHLRLAWHDQPESRDSVLSGTHEAPDLAVTVLSDILEPDDGFPKGLYLRNVGGVLWLRGYVCDLGYAFPADALFAFGAEG